MKTAVNTAAALLIAAAISFDAYSNHQVNEMRAQIAADQSRQTRHVKMLARLYSHTARRHGGMQIGQHVYWW